MIGSLSGIPTIIGPDCLLVEVGGVGYRVVVPARVVSGVKANGQLRLWVHTHVREDMLDLFGFATQEELAFFKILLSISGIGPRTALAIMGQEVEAIKKAVVTGDTEFFAQVPRLGKKNAQKIIIELRPKLGSIGEFDLSGQSGETKDVIDALLVMGFAKREIIEALAKIPKDKTGAEDKIREVLRVLGKR